MGRSLNRRLGMTYCELIKAINDVCYNGEEECHGCFLENVDRCNKLHDYIEQLANEEIIRRQPE